MLYFNYNHRSVQIALRFRSNSDQMAANGDKDADMSEYDGEKVVTMMDVLQEQQDFEEDANAVLGASDDKNCTYSKVNPLYTNIIIEVR